MVVISPDDTAVGGSVAYLTGYEPPETTDSLAILEGEDKKTEL